MKPKRMQPGDCIAMVSLSSGLLGEASTAHQRELIEKRLTEFGFRFKYMPNSLKGIGFLQAHPEARASDLRDAFADPVVRAIVCAIGGDDAFRLAPYLFADASFMDAVKSNPKIFLGFSDTTINHFMLHKCGLNTFYGQALLPDIAELDAEMLPYSKMHFESLFVHGEANEIVSSPIWYNERTDFSVRSLGKPRTAHLETRGFARLSGPPSFQGKILGGCLESLYDMLAGDTYTDEPHIVKKYALFPSLENWQSRILLLETSEGKNSPEYVRHMVVTLKETGLFEVVSGVLIGKPMDEHYYDEYKLIFNELIARPDLPVVYNINVGHALPRCIVPFGVEASVDLNAGIIRFVEPVFAD